MRVVSKHRRGRRLRAVHRGHRACYRGRQHVVSPVTHRCEVCGRTAKWWMTAHWQRSAEPTMRDMLKRAEARVFMQRATAAHVTIGASSATATNALRRLADTL